MSARPPGTWPPEERESPPRALDVLIPTYNRPAALAVTLSSLAAQSFADFRVVVSDQGDAPVLERGEVRSVVRVLELHGQPVEVHRHLPRRGMAEQRQFLLDRATAPHALFIDDDLFLEPWVLGQMRSALLEEEAGFVGCAVPMLRFLGDVRPHQEAIEFWDGPVRPEIVRPDTPEWKRYPLHNAANVMHVARRLGLTHENSRRYKVAWAGACTMYDVAKLRSVGGFSFWRELPEVHCGEDVVAQGRVMARYGGFGLLPSGAYHQELETTLPDRSADAPRLLEPPGTP